MHAWLKISHHSHTGRLRPHEHTSYPLLAVLMLLVGVVLGTCSLSTVKASPGPQAGSVGLSGTVPEKPPTQAATITSPASGQHFTASPITVTGSCPAGTLVEIYKNDIFAGSTPCGSGGSFSLQVDLLFGQNTLVARVYDVLNQPGPDSSPVTVFYDASLAQGAPLVPLNFSGAQLLLNTNAVYRGMFPGQPFSIPINLLGGQPPYAINVEWGDTNNKIISRPDNTAFNVDHTYKKPGTYQITIQATDSQGRVAFLTVAAIVNGQPPVGSASIGSGKSSTSKLLVLWPLYTISATMVVSFWLGERREKRLLAHAMAPVYHA